MILMFLCTVEPLCVLLDVTMLSAIVTPTQFLMWFVHIIATHSEAQTRAQSELDAECGPPADPEAPQPAQLANRTLFPYSRALVWEVL